MKKVGIITLYKDSCNYGGLLQSYALVKCLNSLGCEAKQILLGEFTNAFKRRTIIDKINEHGIKYAFEKFFIRIKRIVGDSELKTEDFVEMKQLCGAFRESIAHTEAIDEDNLEKLNHMFECFIVGSDQVWNPKWMRDVFLLNFADRKKIAYAASIARYDFSRYEKKMLFNGVRKFDWISVREKRALEFLQKEFSISADLVVDPTFLIDREKWKEEEISVALDYEYAFCYFLKPNVSKRRFAHRFADKKKIKLVFPISEGEKFRYDKNNEQMLYFVGPGQWLSLIHHAKYVLTDSFHGTIFSIIYNKQFYHVLRDKGSGKGTMNSRVDSLLSRYGLESRIYNYEDEISEDNIDYKEINLMVKNDRKKSLNLLMEALE